MVEGKRSLVTGALLTILLLLMFNGPFIVPRVTAQSDSTAPLISMPDESLNYTIALVNGVPWAKINGYYPIYQTYSLEGNLPMVYPTPPNTTNISLTCNGEKLNWTDYTAFDPEETHYTDIGNWSMILCLVPLTSNNFVLTIHYEHPIQVINGTYMFLYDLNISPYLSSDSNASKAHFTIRWETKESNIKIYATGTNGTWSQREFSTVNDKGVEVMSFDISSNYSNPLPGDIVITFDKETNMAPYYFVGLIGLVIVVILIIVVVYNRKHQFTS
jgi:hypothetical protein